MSTGHKLPLRLKSKPKLVVKPKLSQIEQLFGLLDQFVLGDLMDLLHPDDISHLAKYTPKNPVIQERYKSNETRKKNNPKLCEQCLKQNGKIKQLLGVRLCDDCNQLPEYQLICKTTAKKTYTLTETDSGIIYLRS